MVFNYAKHVYNSSPTVPVVQLPTTLACSEMQPRRTGLAISGLALRDYGIPERLAYEQVEGTLRTVSAHIFFL